MAQVTLSSKALWAAMAQASDDTRLVDKLRLMD